MRFLKYAIFVIGIAALVALAVRAGMADVVKTLAALDWGGFVLITLLHAPVILMMGVAWWTVGRGEAPASVFIAGRLVRDSVAEVLPFSQIGGYISGLRAANLGGAPLLASALSLVGDLTAEFAAKLPYVLTAILCLLAILPGNKVIWPVLLALAVIVAALIVAFLFRHRLFLWFENATRRLVEKWLPGTEAKRINLGDYFTRDRFLPASAIHLVMWFFGTLEAWVTFRLMGVHVSVIEALVIDAIGTSFRSLGFMVPAAAGVQEAGYVVVGLAFGISPARGIAFSLARRARDLAIGLPGLALWQFLEAKAFRKPLPSA
jgi:putative membrane protein